MVSSMRLVILGGGGHGCVVAESAALSGWIVEGFCDDDASVTPGRGLRRLGAIGDFARFAPACGAVLGIGDISARSKVLAGLGALPWATVVHPRAIVSAMAALGLGVFVGPGAIVNPRARVEAHAIVNSGAIVEHDCCVGENAHIAPATVLCGGVRIGAGTLVGAGSRVIPGVRIGAGCIVGAGSVVLRDVPDGAKVVGCPARQKKQGPKRAVA